ncbi:DUF1127 domain-containing protein [Devosia soli]|uniref:DUF1127 domain-containing protein n=1 Tax=Devosia soli TaxID=361041 RepID=UPI0009FD7474|nr:DUF1127 domain-containing protein [Devosia soli]
MFKPIAHRLIVWRIRSATRRKLALLDDHILDDIGTSRADIGDFVAAQPIDGLRK